MHQTPLSSMQLEPPMAAGDACPSHRTPAACRPIAGAAPAATHCVRAAGMRPGPPGPFPFPPPPGMGMPPGMPMPPHGMPLPPGAWAGRCRHAQRARIVTSPAIRPHRLSSQWQLKTMPPPCGQGSSSAAVQASRSVCQIILRPQQCMSPRPAPS
jgi:hypothetical protein